MSFCQGKFPLLSHPGGGLARASRAASQTSFAERRFTSAIARPTIRSGHAERHANAVTSPAATIATLANASLRADRKAAFVKLPLWRRYLARRIAQKRLTASATSAASTSGSAEGAIGTVNFTKTVLKVASAGQPKM